MLAAAVAGGAALAAAFAGWLRPGAAVAAAMIGWAHLAGVGWAGGALLATLVISGSALTRYLDPDGRSAARRGAGQVLANGGVAAVGALLIPRWPDIGWPILLGALATAQADTWSTEIGRLSPSQPRDLLTQRPVPAGTSGGVTARGTIGGAVGALVIGLVALITGVPPGGAAAAVMAGVAGMLADSALGGSLQTRYLCSVCQQPTEASQHCAQPTRRVSGFPGLGNSAVNAVSTACGSAVAWLAWGWWCC